MCGYVAEEDTSEINGNEDLISRTGGNCLSRVLFLYSDAAESALGYEGLFPAASMVLNNYRIALRRSGIREEQVNTQFIDLIKIIDYVETQSYSTDFNDLFVDFDFHSADGKDILELRNSYEADIVIMFVNGRNKSWLIQGAAGNTRIKWEAGGYVFLDVDYLDDPVLSPHEIGHIFRAEHEDCDCHNETSNCFYNSPSVYNVGHVFNVPKWWILNRWFKTAMYVESGRNIISNYSNPDVKFYGKPTGLSNESAPNGEYARNNTAKVRSEGCTVANFRTTIFPYFVYITGPGTNDQDWFTACECSIKSFEAHPVGGSVGLSTFNWSTSIDGIHWVQIGVGLGGSFISFNVPCLPNDYFAIRVIAVSSSGQTYTSIRRITIVADDEHLPSGQACIARITSARNITDEDSCFQVFPNPSNGNFQIQIDKAAHTIEVVTILDFTGSVVRSIRIGEDRNIELNLPSGLYFVAGKSKGFYMARKLIIK